MDNIKNENAEAQQEEQTQTVESEEAEENEAEVQQENDKPSEVDRLEKQLKDEKEKLLRTAAEYANFRSRTEREKAAIYSGAVSDVITELLPVADSIDRALEAAKDAPEEFKKGIEIIGSQLAKTFEKLNITPFGEVGEGFNPELHDAISSAESEELESDTICQIFQKGYKVGDKIIRHCMVQVVN